MQDPLIPTFSRQGETVSALAEYRTPENAQFIVQQVKKRLSLPEDADRRTHTDLFTVARMGEVGVKPLRSALHDSRMTEAAIEAMIQTRSREGAKALLDFVLASKEPHLYKENISQAWAEMGPTGADVALEALKNPKAARIAMYSLEWRRDPRSVPILIKLADDKKSGLHDMAVWILGKQQDRRAIPLLMRALGSEYTRDPAAEALGLLRAREAVPDLIKLLKSKEAYTRKTAAIALGRIGDTRALKPLRKAYSDKHVIVKLEVLGALLSMGDPDAVKLARELLHYTGPVPNDLSNVEIGEEYSPETLRARVAHMLARSPSPGARDLLFDLVRNREKGIWEEAWRQLREHGDPRALEMIPDFLRSPDEEVRRLGTSLIPYAFPEPLYTAGCFLCNYEHVPQRDPELAVAIAQAVIHQDDPSTAQPLLDFLESCNAKCDYRHVGLTSVVSVLALRKDKRAVAPMIELMEKTDSTDFSVAGVRGDTAIALGEIGDERAVPVLIAALREWYPWISEGTPPCVPAYAADALAKLKDPRAEEPLKTLLGSDNKWTVEKATSALAELREPREKPK